MYYSCFIRKGGLGGRKTEMYLGEGKKELIFELAFLKGNICHASNICLMDSGKKGRNGGCLDLEISLPGREMEHSADGGA